MPDWIDDILADAEEQAMEILEERAMTFAEALRPKLKDPRSQDSIFVQREGDQVVIGFMSEEGDREFRRQEYGSLDDAPDPVVDESLRETED